MSEGLLNSTKLHELSNIVNNPRSKQRKSLKTNTLKENDQDLVEKAINKSQVVPVEHKINSNVELPKVELKIEEEPEHEFNETKANNEVVDQKAEVEEKAEIEVIPEEKGISQEDIEAKK